MKVLLELLDEAIMVFHVQQIEKELHTDDVCILSPLINARFRQDGISHAQSNLVIGIFNVLDRH